MEPRAPRPWLPCVDPPPSRPFLPPYPSIRPHLSPTARNPTTLPPVPPTNPSLGRKLKETRRWRARLRHGYSGGDKRAYAEVGRGMDSVLCDELLQEILQRLPPSCSSSVSLVSKRWLFLFRSSTTILSLRIANSNTNTNTNTNTNSNCSCLSSSTTTTAIPTLSSILSHYPFLSTLTVLSDELATNLAGHHPSNLSSANTLLIAVAASPCAPRLSHLRFLPATALSPSALLLSSSSLAHLTSLQISSLLPLSFRWLAFFPFLKTLSVVQSGHKFVHHPFNQEEQLGDGDEEDGDQVTALPLESLSLSGIRASDCGASWLWRRCTNLRRLLLRACEGTGDGPSSPAFPCCLVSLNELELRTCRSIAGRVLFRAAEYCLSLTSLLLYDGGSRDALHHFIRCRGASLRALDVRLPLDLDNEHLLAIAEDNAGLTALRLQSCCLITGDGLRSLAQAPAGAAIKELAFVNCDVVERDSGLLTFLGQSMSQLRRLDLSHNEMLTDKEIGSMLASCGNLVDIRLRGCRGLTDATIFSMVKCCSDRLEVVDISRCPRLSIDSIELLLASTLCLTHIFVEENKVSEAARALVARRAIIIG